MEKKLEDMSKLADDIVLTEQNERKLFIAYKKRIESQRRKKVLMRGYYRVAVVALAMMIMFSVNYYLQSPDLVVYAATGDKMVQLRLNERVNLEKQRTPLGYGYVLEMSVEEGSRYYTIENEQNLNADNIFRNGNKIFWMPDGMNSINFRDQDGVSLCGAFQPGMILTAPVEVVFQNLPVQDKRDGGVGLGGLQLQIGQPGRFPFRPQGDGKIAVCLNDGIGDIPGVKNVLSAQGFHQIGHSQPKHP